MKPEHKKSIISLCHRTCFFGSFGFSGVLVGVACYFIKCLTRPENFAVWVGVLCFLTCAIPSVWACILYSKAYKDSTEGKGGFRYFVKISTTSQWSTKEERIFWHVVGVLIAIILGFTMISICVSEGESPSIFVTCDEQKEYAIESIKIHTEFVHGLTQSILLIRQSFFVIVTGLLLYHFVKIEKKIPKEKLLLLILFATSICHFYEGIHSCWQSEHLNRICLLTESLDSDIIQQARLPLVFEYKKLPFFEDENKGFLKNTVSVVVFNYSIYLNTNSIVFYYLIFGIVAALVLHIESPEKDS